MTAPPVPAVTEPDAAPSRTPAWITNPDLIASIEAGLIDIDDDLLGDRT